MKITLVILVLFGLSSCQQKPSEQLELILLGLSQDLDTTDISKPGSRMYFRYNGSDSIVVKYCTDHDERTLEPILPVECMYYKTIISSTTKLQLDFLIQYLKPLPNGELFKTLPEDGRLHVRGKWIVIYTGKDNQKKHFVFAANGLPDSLFQLFGILGSSGPDSAKSIQLTNTYINTDSIVGVSCNIVGKEFLGPARSSIKFSPPDNTHKK